MCIIVDANMASDFFSANPSPEAKVVVDWIDSSQGRIVVGGKLMRELFELGSARRWLAERIRRGRARLVPNREVDSEEQKLRLAGICVSDDEHVIALARVSGARTVFTRDRQLERDFTSRGLINSPRGKIYKNMSHRHLLTPDRCPQKIY